MKMPLPVANIPAQKIRAVFTDLDDTLTKDSQIDARTFASLETLKNKGYWVVIVSGRPAGWADCLTRIWPVDAFIFENGAGVCLREGNKVRRVEISPSANPSQGARPLENAFKTLKSEIPHLKLATDQPFRLFDFAIDYAEEPPFLSPAETQRVLSFLGEIPGITAKLSSIHVNYWVGDHTKLNAVKYLLETQGKAKKCGQENIVYCGDSPNDEPLFEFFDHSVGVANAKDFLSRMKHPPKYIAAKSHGAGFEEVVKHLV